MQTNPEYGMVNTTFGTLLDQQAARRSAPEFLLAKQAGLNLVYFYRPVHFLRKGRVDVIAWATRVVAQAQAVHHPLLHVVDGDKPPLAFRWPCQLEVAVIIAWPDRNVWIRSAVLEGRSSTPQRAFVAASGLNLPVYDRRYSRARREQAAAVAIALAATTSNLPLLAYPHAYDRPGRTARDLAWACGAGRLLANWS